MKSMELKMQKNPKKEKQSSFWNNVFNNEEKTNSAGIVDQNLPCLEYLICLIRLVALQYN